MKQCQSCGTYYYASSSHICVATTHSNLAAIGTPVLVTTVRRDVYFGYAKDTTGETIALMRARFCVHRTHDFPVFMQLATYGPLPGWWIGQPADITVRHIATVSPVTLDAVAKWQLISDE